MRSLLPRPVFRFRRTTLLTAAFLAVLAGLGLSRLGWTVSGEWLVFVGVVGLMFVRRKRWYAFIVAVLCGLLLGVWRGGAALQQYAPYDDLFGKKVVLQVVASEDATYGDRSQLEFTADHVSVVEPLTTSLPGKLKISGFGEQMVYRGDVVQVEGKLYQSRGSRQGGISFASMKVVGSQGTSIDTLRREFAAGMQNALPEPLASFGLGLLIGQRSGLPDATATSLAVVGLTHIIAVSGYNLTIIVDAVRRLMSRRSKYQTALLSVVLVIAFILMTGFSASIVRASIVSMLGLFAWYYGRTFRPVLLISLTAAVTALWNPLYLWSDIGWYLSFLAFFGVLVIAPLVTGRLYKHRQPGLIGQVLIETTCAQLMTLPLILYIFEQISLVSLVSNLLVVPLVPLAMLGALIAGIAGMLLPAFAGWFAWPARFLLTYMLDIAGLLSRIPHALERYALSLPGVLYLYVLIMGVVAIAARKNRKVIQ